MTWNIAAVAVAAFGVSVLAPFAFRPLLMKLGVVDVPNARSSHSTTTLRAGGLAPLAGWMIGIAAAAGALPQELSILMIVGLTTVTLAALGFIDDLRGLSAAPRLGAQILIGVIATIMVMVATGSFLWWVAVPLGTLLIVGYVNTANFMDGINGLSSMHGAVVGLAFVGSGLLTGTDWLSYVGAVIAVSFAAFLPWNLHKSGFFLGDVGSYALGGAISVTGVVAMGSGLPPLLVLAPLTVYIADTTVTMALRFARGEKVTSPHRTHAYQRLTDTGLSHIAAASIVTTFAVINTAIAVVVTVAEIAPWLGWLIIAAVCAIYLQIPRWRGSLSTANPFAVPLASAPGTLPASRDRSVSRWAVFGGSGFVGSALVTELRNRGFDVVVIPAPRLSIATSDAGEIDVLLAEASEQVARLDGLVATLSEVDVVVNAAGLAAPDSEFKDELYGANALLPVVVAEATRSAGVGRYVHLSSAAVQGRRPIVDATTDVAPHSPYAHSKSLGERGVLAHAARMKTNTTVILRATSVQGAGRPTTERLIRLARSPIASVAAPGTAPSIVSSITRLVATVIDLGETPLAVPGIVLQPWEGLSTRRVLEAAGAGRHPLSLPAMPCRLAVALAFGVSRVAPRLAGVARRVEVMWFGQGQAFGWGQEPAGGESSDLLGILDASRTP